MTSIRTRSPFWYMSCCGDRESRLIFVDRDMVHCSLCSLTLRMIAVSLSLSRRSFRRLYSRKKKQRLQSSADGGGGAIETFRLRRSSASRKVRKPSITPLKASSIFTSTMIMSFSRFSRYVWMNYTAIVETSFSNYFVRIDPFCLALCY